jgi:hypothetical protein
LAKQFIFPLDFWTGAEVFSSTAVVAVFAGASWWSGKEHDLLSLRDTAPLLLAALWLGWVPALNHWGSPTLFGAAVSDPAYEFHAYGSFGDTTPWWDTWYFLWGVGLGILAIGYGFGK